MAGLRSSISLETRINFTRPMRQPSKTPNVNHKRRSQKLLSSECITGHTEKAQAGRSGGVRNEKRASVYGTTPDSRPLVHSSRDGRA